MNYLAHLFLSGQSEDILVGNFIGDSVRGNQFLELRPAIQQGVLLHRAIDRFTDTHPVFHRSKLRARTVNGRYASVVADVFYDHFLARSWPHYHILPLAEYAEYIYTTLAGKVEDFPDRARQFFRYMVKKNILVTYASIEGISAVLKQMAARARFDSKMELAGYELIRGYSDYEHDFNEFLPQLQKYTSTTLDMLHFTAQSQK